MVGGLVFLLLCHILTFTGGIVAIALPLALVARDGWLVCLRLRNRSTPRGLLARLL
jgi:hypothetical protein